MKPLSYLLSSEVALYPTDKVRDLGVMVSSDLTWSGQIGSMVSNARIRVVTTPGKKLRDILTSSRPLDKKKCPNNNCRTCLALNNNGNCTDRNVVYEVKCSYVECKQSGIGVYNGETYRPIGDRYKEHFRSANNPFTKSLKRRLARAKSVPTHSYSNEVVTLWYRPPDVLLGSTDYSTSLDMWGVGCIFAEMISGIPLFPGMKDVKDQLAKIWQIMGTPTPQTWPNVTKYPDWGKRKYEKYPKQRFVDVITNLSDDLDGEDLLSQMLVFEPSERIAASVSLKHRYFASLPEAIHHLMPIETIYTNGLVEFPG
ncbi:hypothetical protein ACHWQZ_G002482 [Mnemiopsis leidyi]